MSFFTLALEWTLKEKFRILERAEKKTNQDRKPSEGNLTAQWLRHSTSNAGSMGSVSGQGTKILDAKHSGHR